MKRHRFLLRLPKELHQRAERQSERSGISLNDLIEKAVRLALEAGEIQRGHEVVLERALKLYGKDLLGLVLFGSRARCDAHDHSDTDILIVLGEEREIKRALYRDWEDGIPDGISVHLSHLPHHDDAPGSLWLECSLDGVILNDRTGKIRESLEKVKNWVTSGKVIRKVAHGQGYWIHV